MFAAIHLLPLKVSHVHWVTLLKLTHVIPSVLALTLSFLLAVQCLGGEGPAGTSDAALATTAACPAVAYGVSR